MIRPSKISKFAHRLGLGDRTIEKDYVLTWVLLAIAAALSSKYGKPMPWRMVRDALDGAFNAHYLERTVDSRPWLCDYGDAQWVKVRIPPGVTCPPSGTTFITGIPTRNLIAEADLQPCQIQDLAEVMGKLLSAAAGHEMKFHMRAEMDWKTPKEVVAEVNPLLSEIDKGLFF